MCGLVLCHVPHGLPVLVAGLHGRGWFSQSTLTHLSMNLTSHCFICPKQQVFSLPLHPGSQAAAAFSLLGLGRDFRCSWTINSWHQQHCSGAAVLFIQSALHRQVWSLPAGEWVCTLVSPFPSSQLPGEVRSALPEGSDHRVCPGLRWSPSVSRAQISLALGKITQVGLGSCAGRAL